MGLQTYSMKELAALFSQLRNFGSVTSPETVAKYLSEGNGTVFLQQNLRDATLIGRGTTLPWLCVGDGDRK
jgi:hypothetical protein